ncbi:MAG: hypothetical protein KJ623_01465 [Nanoarchaeota archaeon]|nr:hypothetical protein [Nanoarchaeota archaeon]MBU0962821.1 hypothetical protein [Nanoarchaeota archaeon]
MGYISIDWALIKLVSLLFAIIFILIGAYPFILSYYPSLPKIDEKILSISIIILGFIQLLSILKSSRPKID